MSLQKKSFAVVIIWFLSTTLVFAQQTRRHFQADYDAKNTRFGYFIGITNTHLNLKFNNFFVNTSTSYSIVSPASYGIKMGGLVNFRINDYYDFRILPTVAIQSRNLEYRTASNSQVQTLGRESAWFEIPVMVKYKSERRGNARMYVFGGMRYGVETNAINRTNKQKFSTKSSNFSVEYGLGLELFREYFKFAPELHFSHGISNLIDPFVVKGTSLEGIEKMRTHNVTLFFIFE
jgi:hypothetical protein